MKTPNPLPCPVCSPTILPKPPKTRAIKESSAPHATPADVLGAVEAPLPSTLSPQLATLVKKPPTGDAWLYEAKLDGYRILARLENGKAKLFTRNVNDWTSKMPALAKEIESLPF